MESDSWTRLSAASKRQQSFLQSRYDPCLGFEDLDGGGEETQAEFPCPFCSEDFDIVALCCHIDDEHPVEAKSGICPFCAAKVGIGLLSHMTMQHKNFFKMQQRRRSRRGLSGSHSTVSLFRKELRDGNLQTFLGGSGSYLVPPPDVAPDPFLSSLIYALPSDNSSKDKQPEPTDEVIVVDKNSDDKVVESAEPALSVKDQKERACRSEFVQGLLLSKIFQDDDNL